MYKFVRDGKIWMDPESGEQIELCPWLRKEPGQRRYSCAVYFDRPEDCRVYPARISDMIEDQCEMLEPNDLLNLKQAQLLLDTRFKES
jgi:Fe-S-cluster containining protein